jgi:hypothetical protein
MNDTLQNLEIFFTTLFNVANEQARRIRNALLYALAGVAIVYFTQLAFNCTGVTIVVAIICDIISLWKWLDAKRFLTIAVTGEVTEVFGATRPSTPTGVVGEAEVPKLNLLFDLYLDVALYATFWMHTFCFFIPLLSLRENPALGFFFLIGGTAFIIMYPKGTFIRKTFAWGMVIGIVFMIFQTISLAGWVKLGWLEPYWALRTSNVDRVLAEVLDTQRKAVEQATTEELLRIKEKIEKKGTLTKKEEESLKKQRDGLIGQIFRGISSLAEPAKAVSGPVTSAPPASFPPATKKELQQRIIDRPFDFANGTKAFRNSISAIEIPKGGSARYLMQNFPFRRDGKYILVLKILKKDPGNIQVKTGNWKHDLWHPGSDKVQTLFLEVNAECFHPGENQLAVESIGGDIIVYFFGVELTFWG